MVTLGPGDVVFRGQEEVFAAFGECDGVIPDGGVFEAAVGLGVGDLRFEI